MLAARCSSVIRGITCESYQGVTSGEFSNFPKIRMENRMSKPEWEPEILLSAANDDVQNYFLSLFFSVLRYCVLVSTTSLLLVQPVEQF